MNRIALVLFTVLASQASFAQSDIPSAFGSSSPAAIQTLVRMSQSNWKCLEETGAKPATLEKQGNMIVETSIFMMHPIQYPAATFSPKDASLQLNKPLNNQPMSEINYRVIAVHDSGFIIGAGNWDTKQTIFNCKFQ